MKTGLVLEGGAMRGLFTAGVLDALMERGVKFNGLAGGSPIFSRLATLAGGLRGFARFMACFP